ERGDRGRRGGHSVQGGEVLVEDGEAERRPAASLRREGDEGGRGRLARLYRDRGQAVLRRVCVVRVLCPDQVHPPGIEARRVLVGVPDEHPPPRLVGRHGQTAPRGQPPPPAPHAPTPPHTA